MPRILIADSLSAPGIDLLRAEGAEVHVLTDEERPNLHELIKDQDALIVRSGTQVDEPLLRAAKNLKVVGRAGVGVDNIDAKTATELGVLVINSPTSNLMSATEHTFALMLGFARNVAKADASMKEGNWNRKAYVGLELQGKTLGIIGFGQIGQRVAQRAKAFEMTVVAYDPFINRDIATQLDTEAVELDELLERCDVLTFHTPLTDQTRGLLNKERIAKMKNTAFVVNVGRGGVIDEPALKEALDEGQLAGAGIDVWSKEPPEEWSLAKHPLVVATPHLGASTQEAQERVATDTARAVLNALEGSLAVSAINLPFRPAGGKSEPYLRLGEKLGHLASSVLSEMGGALEQVGVELFGVDEPLRVPISVAALKGALQPHLGDSVNFVNAQTLAEARGISVVRSTHSSAQDFAQLVSVSLKSDRGEVRVGGTLYADGDARVVDFEGFRFEFRPKGRLLVVRNQDVPGVVGTLGSLVGEAGVNIADIHLARQGKNALACAAAR